MAELREKVGSGAATRRRAVAWWCWYWCWGRLGDQNKSDLRMKVKSKERLGSIEEPEKERAEVEKERRHIGGRKGIKVVGRGGG
jgi:hypothetical protein